MPSNYNFKKRPATTSLPTTSYANRRPKAEEPVIIPSTYRVVALRDPGVLPPGFRETTNGRCIPQSMHSSSQSANRLYSEAEEYLAYRAKTRAQTARECAE